MRKFIRCLMAIAITFPLACALAHADKSLSTVGAETQQGLNLCWAASSVQMLRMLPPQPLEIGVPAISQKSFAAYNEMKKGGQFRDVATMERLRSAQVKTAVLRAGPTVISRCDINLPSCDKKSVPILLDRSFSVTPANTAVPWARLVAEIDADRPILFGWDSADPDEGRPQGLHFSLVVGYRGAGNTREVRIWDPWVPQGVERSPREKWIPFCTYKRSSNLMGETTIHQFDRFNVASHATPRPLTPVPADPADDCAIIPTSGTGPVPPPTLEMIQGRFGDEARMRETLRGGLLPAPGGPLRLGTALPVLALSSQQITRAHGDAATLIRDEFSAVILPVMRGNEVVDALLAVPDASGGWVLDGYANTDMAALLLEERTRQARALHRSEKQMYALSIPSRSAFFAASGSGPGALLWPVLDDPSFGARAGQTQEASVYLPRLYKSNELEVTSK